MSQYIIDKIQRHLDTMDPEDFTKINDFINEFTINDEESTYPGMSYEQGLRDMLELVQGETTADGITGA